MRTVQGAESPNLNVITHLLLMKVPFSPEISLFFTMT